MTYVSGDILYQSIAKIAATYNAMGALSIAAYDFENKFSAADAALAFDNTNLTAAKGASIFNEAALSITKINDIIINANITDNKAQQILSEITKTDRDLTSATSIYEILDDWDDNKLTSRDGVGTTSTGFTNEFAQKNKFRPEWTTVTGTPSASGGVMVLQSAEVSTPSTFAVGSWEIKYQFASNSDTVTRPIEIYNDSSNFYWLRIDDDSQGTDWDVYKTIAGAGAVLIDTSASNDIAQHTTKLTRDSSGNFEIFLDGVSKGTATNTEITSFTEYHVIGGTDSCNFDDLKIW